MYRLSYRDQQWEPILLRPEFFTAEDGTKKRRGSSAVPSDLIKEYPGQHKAFIGMPPGQGKISDAGYDQMACLVTGIPVCGDVVFRATVRVLRYPSPEERNGQEGLGLFLRDTMASDPLTGYPYSNMAAGGLFRGRPGLAGREGVTWAGAENIRNFNCLDDSAAFLPLTGKSLNIMLSKRGGHITAELTAEGVTARNEIAVNEDMLASREPETIYLGFFASRGCEMEVDLDSVSIEFSDLASNVPTVPVLIAAPDGTGSGNGTWESPLDLQSAITRCQQGQEICLTPGRYLMTKDLVVSRQNSGVRGCCKRITVGIGTGEQAILDFGGEEHGFRIEGDYWDISCLTVTRGMGFQIRGSHNRLRYCRAVSNRETGFLIKHPSSESPKEQWPAYNEITDCESCLNKDGSEQHADGFACKIAVGPGNVFRRCVAWMNSDDGFDLFCKNRRIGAVRLVECRGLLNGYTLQDGKPVKTRGNGNGFKLGGSGMAVDHAAVCCEAIGNRGLGFTSNSNPHMQLYNCEAGNNRKNYDFYFSGSEARPSCVMEDCAETDEPGFDPAIWAEKQALFASFDLNQANTSVSRNALRRVRSLYKEEPNEKPGVLIMCSSLYGGGAERVACRLAQGLSERYRVIMLYIQDKGQTYTLPPEVSVIAMPPFRGTWETVLENRIEFTRQVKSILKIKTAISFMFTMNKMNVRSGEHTRVICSERNNPAKRDPEHLREIEGIYEAADHVVFQSETVRGLFSRKVREHSSIILNPVEVSCSRSESRHRIVNVARLAPQKNQAMLLRAFAAFYRTHRDYTLSIYGAGELSNELHMLAESLGIDEAVQFHGHVWDVHRAVADAEMFVLSSDYEGLSNSLLECMMMGIPCISTRCEGSSDVIRSGENGILVDIGSEKQMAEAMSLLAEDALLREHIGVRGRRTSERFQPERVIGQWQQLI